MKLWRRRPLSVDLTDNKLNVSNEMPPSLVYISPGMHCISKRSSLISNEILLKPQYFSEVSSFNSSEKCTWNAKTTTVESCPLQSFKDYTNTATVSFEDGTIRSSRLANKSYLSPVSAEWFPVKDVMKIKRSASVPFHSQNITTNVAQPTIESHAVTVKSHSSLADKIRTLFRTRSSSRSSKPILTPITECKNNKGKVCLRNSRMRTKGVETCKSMYESSRVQDHEFSNKLNHVLRDCAARSMEATVDDVTQNIHTEKFYKKKDKSGNEKKQKLKNIHCESQKSSSSKGFSESVVSHTASSAAKCKQSPPKVGITQRLRTGAIYRQNDCQVDKKSLVKSNSCKYELPLSRRLSQPITKPNYDTKNCEPYKSDSPTMKTEKIDNEKIIQRKDSLLSNQSSSQSGQCSEDRPDIFERTSSIQRPEEDDYVTLAEVDVQLSFMAQSIHGPIIRELEKSNHEYENIDVRSFQTNNNKQQSPIILKYSNSQRETDINSGTARQKQRPISCIAVVEAERSKTEHTNNRYSSREPPRHMNPKSPYLSQYTKLYSLKVTNGEILYTQQSDPPYCEIMTRSHTSCPYKTQSVLGKETSGKRSIDSGLVDDLLMNFHTDSTIQT